MESNPLNHFKLMAPGRIEQSIYIATRRFEKSKLK